jgi:hypothetical protein
MELEKQVCSLELAKRLKELGVEQQSYFVWVEANGHTELRDKTKHDFMTSAYTQVIHVHESSAPPSPSPSLGRC